MPTYLINGYSGSGKTSIGTELHKRGYKVINTDEEFGYYGNFKTEEKVNFPGAGRVSAHWYKENGWLWNRELVDRALKKSSSIQFFCGGSWNESAFYPRFEKIFRLVVAPEVMTKRLKARSDDGHTNNSEFIAQMLKFSKVARTEAESLGWVVIDTSSKTVDQSADEILDQLN